MPDVGPAAIKRHWIVSGFSAPMIEEDGYGALGSVEHTLWSTLEAAKTRARVLAAGAPGAYFVVYEAEWYAYTDITPVTLRRVGEAVTA